ncbi:GntR family transcriptional regulator [Salipiger pacificus]|uniref:GntR family transcriptional regulator n=2 Tax=Salipiger mangrovisoli TaxID=2865933 RepID=A0ABR9XAE3_9RHOB|nr:GntR family transcriptional regulator [Salipiger mangrovisoli]
MAGGPFEGSGRGQVKRQSVSQQIQESLRARILSLELEPGQNLSRGEIADYYGVSQTPVRDAMMRLEEEGLLVIFPQSKTEVSKIDVAQARETQFLRMSLEIEVAKTLIRAGNPELLAPVDSLLAQMQRAFEEGDLQGFAELDRRFHRALFEAAGVAPLWELVTGRSGHIDRLRKLNLPDPGKVAEILGYHQRIVAAIRAGESGKAESELRGHLTGTLAKADEISLRHPEYF